MKYKPMNIRQRIIKKAFLRVFIVLELVFMVHRMIYQYAIDNSMNMFQLAFFSLVYILAFFFLKYERLSIRNIALGVLVAFFILRYSEILFFWKTFPVVFLSVFPFPFALVCFLGLRKSLVYAGIGLLLLIFTPSISSVLNVDSGRYSSVNFIPRYNLLTIITSTIMFNMVTIYYAIKLKNTKEYLTPKEPELKAIDAESSDYKKLQPHYEKIINFIKTKEVYLNPEYTLVSLSNDIGMNRNYVSRALNVVGGISFNDLLNEHRMKKLMEALDQDSSLFERNLKHLYVEYGFSNQATFNRVFKQFTAYTPTEYIYKLQTKLNKK